MQLSVRKASLEDCRTIARIIWLSERADYALYSYARLFELDEIEFIDHFSLVINNAFDGHGLGYKSYWIIENDGAIVGGFSFYLESAYNSSSMLATGALMEHFSRAKVVNAFKQLSLFKSIQIDKTVGNYQWDSGAVFPEHMGKGFFPNGFLLALEQMAKYKDPEIMEVQIWNLNENALKSYQRIGFKVVKIGPLYSNGLGRILLQKEF